MDHFLTFAAVASMNFIAGFQQTGGGGLVLAITSRSLFAAQT